MTSAAPDRPSPSLRTRRALLAGVLGGLGAALAAAAGHVAPTRAAAGDPLRLGQSNFAGSAATRLSATSSGGAFWMTQNGSGSGVRGESINGTGGVFETRHADRLGLLAQNIADATGTGAALSARGNRNVGLAATSDEATAISASSHGGSGLMAVTDAAGAVAVSGEATGGGATIGVLGTASSGDGFASGVIGLATATTGLSRGVHGRSDSGTGGSTGVWGRAAATTGATSGVDGEAASSSGRGVFGHATSSVGTTYGVRGEASSPIGYGLFGTNFAATGNGIGVQGVSQSAAGFGVVGVASSSGDTTGVYGESGSPDGSGLVGAALSGSGETNSVLGQAQSSSGTGVRGVALGNGEQAAGVVGDAGTGTGVLGHVAGLGYAVRGIADNALAHAGHFTGKVEVIGDLLVTGDLLVSGAKSFRIDHPDDPANRYLLHYCTEGSEPLNSYSGTVVLGVDGRGVVKLPDWFEAINTDVRYQLTPIGGAAPDLHVVDEVADGRFVIGGGQAGQKVSWQLTARRADAGLRDRAIRPEVAKPADATGTYLQPLAHGRPAEEGLAARQPTVAPPPAPRGLVPVPEP